MSNINDLKDAIDSKTLNFALLTAATMGIYPILWLSKNSEIISGLTNRKTVGSAFFIWIAVCVGVGRVMGAIQDETMIVMGLLISLAGNVLYVVWAFKAKTALQEYCLDEYKIDLKMNVFYTVLMNVFYINYCINDLPEVQRKDQILRERTVITQ